MIDPVLPLFLFTVAAFGLLLPWGAWRWLRRRFRRFSAMTPAERDADQARFERRVHLAASGCLAVVAVIVIVALAWVTIRGMSFSGR